MTEKVDFKKQTETLTKALQGTMVLSIAYLPGGSLLTAALSHGQDIASLRATQAALRNILTQIGEMLLEAAVGQATSKPE